MPLTDFVLSEYVTTSAGQPYRLFPFGTFWKGGMKRTLTKESAASFRLPHFKPPIKLGSHEDETPAGGQIVALEVREDGLYAIPEFTEKGLKALDEGDYRYHSPEVIWEGDGIEDPVTGKLIPGPIIFGDAFLHYPHLGEMAALYTTEILRKEIELMDEVEKTLLERFTAAVEKLFKREEPEPEPPPVVEVFDVTTTEEYKAAILERESVKAELETLKAEQIKREQFTALVGELQKVDKFGAVYVSLATAEEAAGMLSGMSPEQREWVMRNFSALIAQVKESGLTGEIGSTGDGAPSDPVDAFNAAIQAKAAEMKIPYAEALNIVIREQPELARNYRK